MTARLTACGGDALEVHLSAGLPVLLALCETEQRTRDHTLLPGGTRLCHRCTAGPPPAAAGVPGRVWGLRLFRHLSRKAAA